MCDLGFHFRIYFLTSASAARLLAWERERVADLWGSGLDEGLFLGRLVVGGCGGLLVGGLSLVGGTIGVIGVRSREACRWCGRCRDDGIVGSE